MPNQLFIKPNHLAVLRKMIKSDSQKMPNLLPMEPNHLAILRKIIKQSIGQKMPNQLYMKPNHPAVLRKRIEDYIFSFLKRPGNGKLMKLIQLFRTIPKKYLSTVISPYAKYKRHDSKLATMKLNLSKFNIFTEEVTVLSDMFKKHKYELRIAGGAVRDILMDKMPQDIDFATVATPDDMKDMFDKEGVRMLHHKGESHGTVTVRINDRENFEITTLRIDMKTDGRHAEVQFTTDWELDAGRRDLTINAMFLGLDGTLYDYFKGKEDLEKRVVRFVGVPENRIQEDYLRILRYFRFYGRIADHPNKHEASTLDAIRRNVEGLGKISGERIWTELKKILAGNFAKEIMLRMLELGIGPFIGLPEKYNTFEFENVCSRSKDMKPKPVTLLTALLKNETDVMALHSRLKFSKNERDLALFIVNHRDKETEAHEKPFHLVILESRNKMNDVMDWSCEVLKYRGDSSSFEALRTWKVPKFPVNGHMLAERGYKPGPKMTEVMIKLKKQWFESNYKLTKDQLVEYLDKIKD